MSHHCDGPGGDAEFKPVVGVDLVQPGDLASEPAGKPGSVLRQCVFAADFG
jgi:hypothetical protein